MAYLSRCLFDEKFGKPNRSNFGSVFTSKKSGSRAKELHWIEGNIRGEKTAGMF